jgi:hypothetical protein
MNPYLIVGTPRSRTTWLSQFLSTPERRCRHEPSLRWSHPSDLADFLADDEAAAADCMMTFLAGVAREIRPDCKIVVVVRPIDEVRESLFSVGLEIPRSYLEMMDRKARAIDADLFYQFRELDKESVIQNIAETCLGFFDREKWLAMKDVNVQSNVQETIRLLVARNDVHGRLYGPHYDHH